MKSPNNCSSCGAPLPADGTLAEVCVACALALALDRSGAEDSTIARDRSTPEPSRIIGPYRLLQKIGEGGMGEVWQAEQTEPVRRRVALKVIKLGMDTKQVIARFEAERQALAMMDHPCVSKVLDAGSTPEGRPFFLMEYVSGLPITEHCDRHTLTTSERLELFMQVCDGVQHAQQKAIIHRDLKPSNVLVALQDGVAVPKIIDFGVAKATAQRLTEKTLFTEIGVLIGTPEYMSPEQADPTVQDVDTRTDVYALGVMLYELLSGALPFDSRALREAGYDGIRRMIREVEPPKPSTRLSTLGGEQSAETAKQRRVDLSTLRRQLSGELDWITMRALEKDRARRYGSPAELAEDLRRHVRNEPVLAGPPSAVYRARKFVRRHRFGVATATVGVLALVGFAVTMGVQTQRIKREAESKRRVSEFLTELFEVSDPSEARGNSITARELLDKGAARIRGTLADDPKVRAELMMTMGVVYRNLGLFPQAEPLLKEALEARRRLLGTDDPETLCLASETATLHFLQGRYQEAEALGSETLDIRRRVLGPEHPDTLRSMYNLADVYWSTGRQKEGEALYSETYNLQKRVLGLEHPDTLRSMNTAVSYLVQDYSSNEAEALCREALDIQKRVLGSEHPDTLRSMSCLGGAYWGQGRFKEAEALHRETLDIQRRVLGPEHPETLQLMSLLAYSYYARGQQYEEAEGLCRETLDIQKRVLGPEHPSTLASMGLLASVHSDQGHHKEAEALHRETLDIQRRVLGPEHPSTLASMRSLAIVFSAHGRHEEAEALYRETLDIQKRVLGPEDLDTLWSMFGIAQECWAQGRHKEAEQRYRETLDISKRAHGPEHETTLVAMYEIAGAYLGKGRSAEALALYRELLEIQKRKHGPEHEKTLLAICSLACAKALLGERSEALRYLREAVEHGFSDAEWIIGDSDLGSLHGDPEFEKIVAAAKANQEKAARPK